MGRRGNHFWRIGRSATAGAFARLGAAAALFTAVSLGSSNAVPEGDRSLRILQTHTGEQETVVYKRNGVYDKAGIARLNYLVRDWRKDRPTNMDPHLYDLLWQVYQASGSNGFIHVVCGYRSPDTNEMLRRRSKGVAKHSQHMLGKAMDFFIPGVPLAKLREIGLRMQVGGVGYYPSSRSGFVHMDTGSVRMWPKMSRDQLARVFPHGKSLYIPSDGKPLPGYAEALAAYKSRKAGSVVMLASADEVDEDEAADEVTAKGAKDLAAAGYSDLLTEVPLPRLANRPVQSAPAVVAMVEAGAMLPRGPQAAAPRRLSFFDRAFGLEVAEPASGAPKPRLTLRDVDFDAASEVSTPVPAALAAAMAARDRAGRASPGSLPIAPTAIVATVDISRPLRAEAMTTAVLRKGGVNLGAVPPVLSYAAPMEPLVERPRAPRVTSAGIPVPLANPLRNPRPAPAVVAEVSPDDIYSRLPIADLTLTALDTQGLRLWIATQSTREKRYALLTMPDFSQAPTLLDKPTVSFGASFGDSAKGLRTDHFSGALIQPPAVVDLTVTAVVAAR